MHVVSNHDLSHGTKHTISGSPGRALTGLRSDALVQCLHWQLLKGRDHRNILESNRDGHEAFLHQARSSPHTESLRSSNVQDHSKYVGEKFKRCPHRRNPCHHVRTQLAPRYAVLSTSMSWCSLLGHILSFTRNVYMRDANSKDANTRCARK
jgi:hypothetical protein